MKIYSRESLDENLISQIEKETEQAYERVPELTLARIGSSSIIVEMMEPNNYGEYKSRLYRAAKDNDKEAARKTLNDFCFNNTEVARELLRKMEVTSLFTQTFRDVWDSIVTDAMNNDAELIYGLGEVNIVFERVQKRYIIKSQVLGIEAILEDFCMATVELICSDKEMEDFRLNDRGIRTDEQESNLYDFGF